MLPSEILNAISRGKETRDQRSEAKSRSGITQHAADVQTGNTLKVDHIPGDQYQIMRFCRRGNLHVHVRQRSSLTLQHTANPAIRSRLPLHQKAEWSRLG